MQIGERQQFEPLHHQGLDAQVGLTPLLFDEEGRLTLESQALLDAADIVKVNLEEAGLDGLKSLAVAVEEIMADHNVPGLIIEDQGGYGSVTISHIMTNVSVARQGSWQVPTSLFHGMLSTWIGYGQAISDM